MEINLRYTKHQAARGTRPDAETPDRYYLFKNVSLLHATYQIKLLTYFASINKKKLIIRVPKTCKATASLLEMLRTHSKHIALERI